MTRRINEINVSQDGVAFEYIPRGAQILGVGFRPSPPNPNNPGYTGWGTMICWFMFDDLTQWDKVQVEFKQTYTWDEIGDDWYWAGAAVDGNGTSRHVLYRPQFSLGVQSSGPRPLCQPGRELDLG